MAKSRVLALVGALVGGAVWVGAAPPSQAVENCSHSPIPDAPADEIADITADGSLVVFSSRFNLTAENADGNHELFTWAPATQTLTQITDTTTGYGAWQPQISDDGSTVAYLRVFGATSAPDDDRLNVVDVATGVERQVAFGHNGINDALTGGFAIDGDGDRVVVATADGAPSGNEEIWLWQDGETPTLTRLTDGGATSPTISDDGDLIAFSASDGNEEIFTHDVSADTTTQLTTTGEDTFNGSPQLSGDGGRVAFNRFVGDTSTIVVRQVAGGAVASIPGGVYTGHELDTDGDRLVFDSPAVFPGLGPNTSTNSEVYLANLAGASPTYQRVTDTPGTSSNGYPHLAGNGQDLVYAYQGDVHVGDCATPPAVRRPDAELRRSTEQAFVGNNVYNTTGANQTRTIVRQRNRTATFFVRIRNDGNVTESYKVTGTRGNARYTVVYRQGSTVITGAVTAGTHTLANVAPGATRTIRVDVTPRSSAPRGNRNTLVTVRTATAPVVKDTVKAVVHVG